MTVVQAPLAFVRTDDGTVELEHGEPVPDNADAEHVALLVSQGVLGEAEVQPEVKPVTRDEILEEVGDDPIKAQAALEVEEAGENRVTLVKGLKKVIAAHPSAPVNDTGPLAAN